MFARISDYSRTKLNSPFSRLAALVALIMMSGTVTACELSRKECAYYAETTSQVAYCAKQAPKTCNSSGSCYGGGYCERTAYRTVTSKQCQSYVCKAGYIERNGSCLTAEEIAERAARRQARVVNQASDADDQGLSLFQLGYDHELGRNGYTIDLQKAAQYYEQACDRGASGACFNLGRLYQVRDEFGMGLTGALVLYRRACEMDNGGGCYSLGYNSSRRLNPPNHDEGTSALKRSCDLGDVRGCGEYAINLTYGYGTQPDLDEAKRMINFAIEENEGLIETLGETDVLSERHALLRQYRNEIYITGLPTVTYEDTRELRETEFFDAIKDRFAQVESWYAEGIVTDEQLAQEHGSLAWFALFQREFELAERHARRGLDLAPHLIWIEGNLAHALMFQDRETAARNLYQKNRGQRLTALNDQLWSDMVRADFQALDYAGISHPLMLTFEIESGS